MATQPLAFSRAILHVDMDAFFASVEQLDNPSLRGKPVLVGGAGRRGVVAAASYEARKFGCRSAMPTAVALRLCPHAIVVKGSFARYSEISSQVFGILGGFSPLVEPLSVDEAFVDVSGSPPLFGPAPHIAQTIREQIHTTTGLTASVGVATNKLIAKIASDANKPDGLTVVHPGDESAFLSEQPIGVVPGLGPATQARLHKFGLRTVGQLARAPLEQLQAVFGEYAQQVHDRANGRDDRPVRTDRERKSISQERTFAEDLLHAHEARALLLWHVESVGHRLRSKGLIAGGIVLKLRYGDFETISRSASINPPTDTTATLWHAASELFDRWASVNWKPLRLLGFGVDRLSDASMRQTSLFEDNQRDAAVDRVKDAVINKFGANAIHPAGALGRPRQDRK